jgi:8-oxo-dGTP diphosphatase
MSTMSDPTWPKVPYVGVGCIVVRDGRLLMVRSHRGAWSTPGGHLDFGESPAECAARETAEETGLAVTNVEFVAITNDVLPDVGRHYVTIWMRADAPGGAHPSIGDVGEIAEVGWYAPDALPGPLFPFFENLIAGRCMPPRPANMPLAVHEVRADGGASR